MTTQHVDYPHEPGTLYDCPPCEEQMFEEAYNEWSEDTYDPDTPDGGWVEYIESMEHPYDTLEEQNGHA